MKLAEALVLRADLQKKLENLKKRLANSVLKLDDIQVIEDPAILKLEADETIAILYSLIDRIYRTNQSVILPSGQSMVTFLAKRDELVERRKLLDYIINKSLPDSGLYFNERGKWQPAIDISAYQKQMDDIAMQIRRLNLGIQQTNWQVDLVA
ncbi:DIP1984 family protein [Moraxella osloensis]|nr:DIP1984 family protein [Moraxella osloensis]MBW4018383.1 DIP1984 family protein [Moraxella osloensis]